MTSVRDSTGATALPPRTRPRRWLAATALLASAAIAALGTAWWLVPDSDPFVTASSRSLASAVLDPTQFAAVVIATGLVGIVVAVALLARGAREPRAPFVAAVAAALLALAATLVLGDAGTITFAGYVFGFCSVVAGVVTTCVLVVRAPRLGVPLLVLLVALVVVAVSWAGLTWQGVTTFLGKFGAALVANAGLIAVSAISVVAVLAWVAIAVSVGRTTREVRRFEGWLVRHRRVLTVLAALGPLPYAVVRASWLTPWPLFAPAADELSPAMLTTGLMLGAGAVAAVVLTLGLILPWGLVFPAWMPRVGGRTVPARLAVVPGLAAATVVTISAVPMLIVAAGSPTLGEAIVFDLLLPFWFWGPMLALAVWAYAAWRRELSRPVA
ncbi:hypothetical protein [Agromyces sp. NPDC055658]